jgi:hypothetical protein
VDRGCIILEGKKLAEGTPRELINNDLVKRAYLGGLFRGDEFDAPARSATFASGAAQGATSEQAV